MPYLNAISGFFNPSYTMKNNTSTFVSVILLAAGESHRMGKPKLLLSLGDNTILGTTLNNILNSNLDEVIVVLGANAKETKKAVISKAIKTYINPDYKQGMSTSLICGLKHVSHQAKKVMVALSDQPLIGAKTYNKLIRQSLNSNRGIVVPTYKSRRGNPIIFDICYKEELLKLKGDVGGRELLIQYPDDILEVAVDCEGICINLNTIDDYKSALNLKKGR
jgi:molybdenum cofactor cytidylyltransferase